MIAQMRSHQTDTHTHSRIHQPPRSFHIYSDIVCESFLFAVRLSWRNILLLSELRDSKFCMNVDMGSPIAMHSQWTKT